MSDVSVIGLGAMGSALARKLLERGYSVTVWNRTRAKARPFVERGAPLAASPAAAVDASPTTVVCVGTYADTNALLGGAEHALTRKTLIQLSTGNAAEATQLAARVTAAGGEVLIGVILAYPSGIGDPNGILLVAGDEPVWRRCEAIVRVLGGASRWLGTDVSVPATLEVALNAPAVGMMVGAMQGALLCERGGFDVAKYREILGASFPVGITGTEHLLSTIANNRFEAPEASLEAYAAAYSGWTRDARARGVNAEFLAFVDGLLARGVAAGYGNQELSAVMKLWRH